MPTPLLNRRQFTRLLLATAGAAVGIPGCTSSADYSADDRDALARQMREEAAASGHGRFGALRFRGYRGLAALPYFDLDDHGLLRLTVDGLPPVIDFHAHLGMNFLFAPDIDLLRRTAAHAIFPRLRSGQSRLRSRPRCVHQHGLHGGHAWRYVARGAQPAPARQRGRRHAYDSQSGCRDGCRGRRAGGAAADRPGLAVRRQPDRSLVGCDCTLRCEVALHSLRVRTSTRRPVARAATRLRPPWRTWAQSSSGDAARRPRRSAHDGGLRRMRAPRAWW